MHSVNPLERSQVKLLDDCRYETRHETISAQNHRQAVDEEHQRGVPDVFQ